jgi:hypothetical protein
MARHILKKMTRAEVLARVEEKRNALLRFLCSGEVYTSLQIAAAVMGVSERSARDTLKALVRDRLIKVDAGLPQKVYGLSAHGIAMTEGAHPACREFQAGKLNPSYLNHHIQTQWARLVAEAAGWTEWIPGRVLYAENEKRLKKLPDAIAKRPDGRMVALEVENFTKSNKRIAVVIGLHLQQITAGHYQLVYYLTPHPKAQRRAFDKISVVPINSKNEKKNGVQKITLTDAHRRRLIVRDMSGWKGE